MEKKKYGCKKCNSGTDKCEWDPKLFAPPKPFVGRIPNVRTF